MITDTPKLQSTFHASLPEFVRENYSGFATFMKAYYRWMEETNRPRQAIDSRLTDLNAVDEALYTYFQNTYLQNIPVDNVAIISLIKSIKQFYRAKGSDQSFELLFRILGDDTADFSSVSSLEPITESLWKIVVPSAGVADSFLIAYLIDKQIGGLTSGASGILRTVAYQVIDSTTYLILTLSDVTGTFQAGELLRDERGSKIQPTYAIQSQIVDVNITDGGVNYAYADTVNIHGDDTATLEIGLLGGNDSITRFRIVSGGVGFSSAPTITVNSNTGFGLAATTILGGASHYQTFSNTNIDRLTFVINTVLSSEVYAKAVRELLQPAGTLLASVNQTDDPTAIAKVSTVFSENIARIESHETSMDSGAAVVSATEVQQVSPIYLFIGVPSMDEVDADLWNIMSPATFEAVGSEPLYPEISIMEMNQPVYLSSSTSWSAHIDWIGNTQLMLNDFVMVATDRNPAYGVITDGDAGDYLVQTDNSSSLLRNLYGVTKL